MSLPEDEAGIRELCQELLEAWNNRSGEDYAALFLDDGAAVGFDGYQHAGREQIAADLSRIFADHPTGRYVGKVRNVQMLTSQVGLLRAVAGLVPAGQQDIKPELNAVQSLVAVKQGGTWRITLFQNTPAQFHGRPDLAEELTEELRLITPHS